MMPTDDSRQPLATTHNAGPWLTLKDASEFLGVHFTTLRKWADEGEIRVFRTPGGHRRFSVADLRRFLEERVSAAPTPDTGTLLDEAVDRVRAEIQRMPHEHGWVASADESARDLSRQRGRQLFSLAISYVLKPAQRDRLMDEGRQLGLAYGRDAALNQITLTETGRAVQFFRSQLNQALRSSDTSAGLDADDVRVQQIVNHFLDEVLYAVLNGYEQEMGRNAG